MPWLPYASVSPFIPPLCGIIQRYTGADSFKQQVRAAVYLHLGTLFECGSGANADVNESSQASARAAVDIVQCRRDIADFAASDAFDPLLEIDNMGILRRLLSFVTLFDDLAFTLAFTHRRLEHILSFIDKSEDNYIDHISLLMALLAVLVPQFPKFSEKLACASGFARIVLHIGETISGRDMLKYQTLPHDMVRVFDGILSSAPAVARTVQQLLVSGVMKVCCTFLRFSLALNLSSEEQTPEDVQQRVEFFTRLLLVVRVMVNSSDTLPDYSKQSGNGDASRNPCLAQFVACHGLRAF